MMKRKLIELGQGSMVVSIPSKFVKKNNLVKGQEIEIEEVAPSQLLIKANPMQTNPLKKAIISIKNKDEFMQRLIHRKYTDGYDEITINFEDKEVLELTEKAIDSLIGYDIIELGENRCIIRSLSSENENEFENVLRRLFLLIVNTCEESFKSISNNEYNRLDVLTRFGATTNKYTFFCERLLKKGIILKEYNSFELYTLVWTLEQIADNFTYIWKTLISSSNKLPDPLINRYNTLIILLRNFYELFYNRTKKKIYDQKQAHNEFFRLKTNPKTIEEAKIFGLMDAIADKLFHLSAFILPKEE
jgi:phosphate uptake regulator